MSEPIDRGHFCTVKDGDGRVLKIVNTDTGEVLVPDGWNSFDRVHPTDRGVRSLVEGLAYKPKRPDPAWWDATVSTVTDWPRVFHRLARRLPKRWFTTWVLWRYRRLSEPVTARRGTMSRGPG